MNRYTVIVMDSAAELPWTYVQAVTRMMPDVCKSLLICLVTTPPDETPAAIASDDTDLTAAAAAATDADYTRRSMAAWCRAEITEMRMASVT